MEIPQKDDDIFCKRIVIAGVRRKMQIWRISGGWCARIDPEGPLNPEEDIFWENGWGQTAERASNDLLEKLSPPERPLPRWFKFLGPR
jgi:hypothetical protein